MFKPKTKYVVHYRGYLEEDRQDPYACSRHLIQRFNTLEAALKFLTAMYEDPNPYRYIAVVETRELMTEELEEARRNIEDERTAGVKE